MEKIILTQDIQLNKLPSSPGGDGIVIVQQDSVGNRRVTLADGNIGSIEIALTPGSVTQLNWTRDDVSVYWTAEILTPQLIINQPQQITNLITYVVDSNGVKIRWSAPMGNPPIAEVKADKYRIFISQSEIDPNYGITDLPEYKQSLIPKAPGEQEEIVISQLLPGHKYYLTVISEKVIFGKNKTSAPSNTISFITSANDVVASIAPRIIPVNPLMMYPQGLVYAKDPDTQASLIPQNLSDLSNIIDLDGVPQGDPNLGMAILMYGLGDMPQYNRPSWDTIIDLESAWNIEYLYVWLTRNGDIDIQTSIDGVTFDTVASLGASIVQNKWSKVLVNTLFTQGVRFVNIAFKKSEHGIRGFLMYGKRSERGEIRGKKFKRTVEARKEDEKIGTNAFLLEDEDMVRQVSRHTRVYVESDWLVGPGFKARGAAYENGNGAVIIGVDDVRYQFESQNIWNWDVRLADYLATGQKIMMSTVNVPLYLRPNNYNKPEQSKPVDPGLNPIDLLTTTNPLNYKHIARLAYNIAARFGSNPDADPQYIQLTNVASPGFPNGDTLKIGLDILESLEFRNEADAYWTGANGYHNWEEHAAMLSALYDGHKGALGAGFGAKAADPNLKISMCSLAIGGNIGYLKRMMLWWDLNRGVGDYPMEIINFHHYNSSGGSQVVPVYSDVPSEGVPPEQAGFMKLVKNWCDFRDSQFPTAELRITEIGYDEHYGGVYSPGYREQSVRSKYKGYWITRTYLLGSLQGLDITNLFWFSNDRVRLEDLDPNVKLRDVFITAGVTDGINKFNDFGNRKPLVSFWYIANLMTEITGYSLSYPISIFGSKKAGGLVFETFNPDLIALAYKNDNGDTLITAWLGSVGFKTGYFKLYVHPSESTVQVIRLDNAEIRQDYNGGLHETVNTLSDAQGKYIEIMLNECPTIIKTKNVGVEILITPKFFNIEAVSNSVVKLAWEDENIGSNLTKIYQSNLQDRDFEEVFSGYIDNGEHIFIDLLEGTNYFYKIGFEDNGIVSELSEAIGITTLSTLYPPTNLRIDSKSSTSITLKWDYSLEDQAKIDEFELYRSLTVNGIYSLVSVVNKASRTFTNNGLTANTQYFFKMRSKKDFGFSGFTLGFGATTDGQSELPPTLLNSKSNYAGDRLKLTFDIDLANPAGQEAGFSIIETISGTPSYISPAALSLDASNAKILYIRLSTLVANSESTLSISYDKGAANLQSTNAIKVESFTSVAVTNNRNNIALLSRKIQVNLTNETTLQGVGWNDIVYLNTPESFAIDAQAYTKNLKDINGVSTNIEFIMPSNTSSGLGNRGKSEAGMIETNDPNFPINTSSVGVNIGNRTYGLTSLAIFQNLDSTKEYNIRALFSFYRFNNAGAPRQVYYKNWQSLTYLEQTIPNLSTYVTSLKALTAQYVPHASGDGYPVIDNINTPKVGISFQQDEPGVWITAIILEEVLPE